MSPRPIVFTRQAIVGAGLQLVRDEGWGSLTARAVADRLGASVAPLYKVFGSMADLERAVLEEARRLLEEFMQRSHSELEFLDIGVGLVEFARDEPNLFRALYQARHDRVEIVSAIDDSILGSMRRQPLLGRLSEESRQCLLGHVRLYTLGLATAVAAGWWPDPSTAAVVRELGHVGHIFIAAEAGDAAACAAPLPTGARNQPPPAGPATEEPFPGRSLPDVSEIKNNKRFFEED